MRDDFSQQTLDVLAKRVGVRCSNPACRKLTTGPRTDSSRIINIGVGAHITAAAEGGPRFDPHLLAEARKSPDNGIWLCQNCAKLVDNDPSRYTVEVLREWKHRAEGFALSEVEGLATEQRVQQEITADIEISYQKLKMFSERHDYLLEIKLRNLGSDPLSQYHIDLEFSARVLERPQENRFFIQGRSNRDVSFFRATAHINGDTIYPGDTVIVLSIPYYMNHEIYFNRGNLFAQLVRATLYRSGFRPLTLEKPFGELQFF
ncbi:hypothetical protein KKG71_05075 [Patescibacteria group bacterium]|nr:hypothetical protein [Patescibacteria group bacterium]